MAAATAPAEFDWAAVPLEGVRLVEAGAGTGKTYAIIRLYLRLLLESGIPVDRILVLTFTQAATAELQERIYSALSALSRALRNPGMVLPDAGDQKLLDAVDAGQAAKRINAALACFEEATIYTIHGLCRRILSEHAFECGLSLGAELKPGAAAGLSPLARDYWRRHVYASGPLYAGLFMRHFSGGPEDLCPGSALCTASELRVLDVPATPPPLPALDAQYTRAFECAAAAWEQQHAEVLQLLGRDDALNRRSYAQQRLPEWAAALDRLFCLPAPTLDLPEAVQRLSPPALAQGTRKDCVTPEHPFFNACGRLCELRAVYQVHLAHARCEFMDGVSAAQSAQGHSSGLLGYDDLLYEVYRALQEGALLHIVLEQNIGAVLVDEFQDTDDLQHRILSSLWQAGQPAFLVGDPRQAIYGFRGADIYAYLRARRQIATTHRYTLSHNRRSVPGLVAACNALFSTVQAPFVEAGIPFVPARTAAPSHQALRRGGAELAPMVLWWHYDTQTTARQLEQRAAAATAAEIAALLAPHGGAELEERPLAGADIAVLVRSHRQGHLMLDALRRAGVGCVLYGAGSVFAGRMAEELLRVLHAVAEPDREDRVRAALSTLLFGMNAEDLLRMEDSGWDERMRDFHRWRGLWGRHGFMLMFQRLLEDSGAHIRLAGGQGGERDLTDLRHLAELVQAQERAGRRTPESVLGWFGERLAAVAAGGAETPDEERVRLDSDARLVRVATIHRSKGLEYEVVCCPFLWKANVRTSRMQSVYCHDPEQGERALWGFGVDAKGAQLQHWRTREKLENLAEELRLCYVALTRARRRCYLTWAHIRQRVSWGALAWLLHEAPDADPMHVLQGRPRLYTLSQQEFIDELHAVAARADGGLSLEPLPGPLAVSVPAASTAQASLSCRTFDGTIRTPPEVSSYSALVRGHGSESPDHDAGDASPPVSAATDDIHALPAGAHTGRCLHALLEHLDFAECDVHTLERLTASTLTRHGLDAERWTPAVVGMVEQVLDAALDTGVRLRGLPGPAYLREMEFYFRLRGLSAQGLQQVLDAHGGIYAELCIPTRTHFAPVQGAMKGFIDLVFEIEDRYYIVDYKSNRLGGGRDAYTQDRMRREMQDQNYVLQYLIYMVALHRYLRDSLPGYRYEKHCGGARYLFLRGLEAGTDRGVCKDLPPADLIRALDEYLDSEEVQR